GPLCSKFRLGQVQLSALCRASQEGGGCNCQMRRTLSKGNRDESRLSRGGTRRYVVRIVGFGAVFMVDLQIVGNGTEPRGALRSVACDALRGEIAVPGDKSISHRAVILGGLAVGETRITGLLEGEDVLRTAAALRSLGASVERTGVGEWRIHGV